jgi:putative glycosyltransferase
VQAERGGGVIKAAGGGLFYKLFNAISTQKIPENFLTVRLMSRNFVNAALQFQETQIFLGGLWALAGFQQIPYLVDKQHRKSTSYSFKRRVSLLVDAVTSFTQKPLMFVFYLGLFIAVISGILGMYLLLGDLFSGQKFLMGWRSIVVSLWFIGGLTICCLGIIGIYLSKIFLEVKRRPLAFVRKVHLSKS